MNNKNQKLIGSTKTVLIFDNPGEKQAVVSSVQASCTNASENKVVFTGPVSLNNESKSNIREIALEITDILLLKLNINMKNYKISISNIGASSALDRGMQVSGYSAELPILLAMLSAALRLPISQDIVCTGHLSSINGDLAAVSSLIEKITAAEKDPKIQRFVYPNINIDRSMITLIPESLQELKDQLAINRESLKLYSTDNIAEVLKIMVSNEDIVTASLDSGFFNNSLPITNSNNPIDNIATWFLNDNEKRFWRSLERYLLNENIALAKSLLVKYILFHNDISEYPKNLGGKLYSLLSSLPITIKRGKSLFPLIQPRHCLGLTQFAADSDYEDVQKLLKASSGDFVSASGHYDQNSKRVIINPDLEVESKLNYFLEALSAESIAEQIFQPIDNARVSYRMEQVVITSYNDFIESITSFYIHLLRHLEQVKGKINRIHFEPDAIALVERAYRHEKGVNLAYEESLNATKGGLRYIYDMMTDTLKVEEKEKYIRSVFKSTVDPLAFDDKVTLIKAFFNKVGSYLPDDIKTDAPEKYHDSYEEIIRGYSESLDRLINKLRTM